MAWDVFGTGRTALKLNLGKYLQAATNQTQYVINNPASMAATVAAAPVPGGFVAGWTDSNGNFSLTAI